MSYSTNFMVSGTPASAAASSASAAAAASPATAAFPSTPPPSSSTLAAFSSNPLAAAGSSSSDDLVDRTRHPSGIIPTIQNVVSTVNLGVKIDLKSIAMRARNAEYNPRRFAAVVLRIRDPKSTALLFHSGKMVVTGCKSEEASRLAARKYARIIQKVSGLDGVRFTEFKIQNMVASTDVRFPIRLEALAGEHDDFSTYEPELFPGLIYRMLTPKVALLIFVSGKVVLTGGKSREQLIEAFEYIYPVLTEFRKETIAYGTNNQGIPLLGGSQAYGQGQGQGNQPKSSKSKSKKKQNNQQPQQQPPSNANSSHGHQAQPQPIPATVAPILSTSAAAANLPQQ